MVSLLIPPYHSPIYPSLSSINEEVLIGKMSSEKGKNKQEQILYELVGRFF